MSCRTAQIHPYKPNKAKQSQASRAIRMGLSNTHTIQYIPLSGVKKNAAGRAAEVAQQLRALLYVAENSGLITRAHMVVHTIYNYSA